MQSNPTRFSVFTLSLTETANAEKRKTALGHTLAQLNIIYYDIRV